MKKSIKNRLLSTTLSVMISSTIVMSNALPVFAASNAPILSNILSKVKSALTPSQELIDQATNSINSLLNNNNVTKSVVDNAKSLLNKIPANSENKSVRDRLQSAIDKANEFLTNSEKVNSATDSLNKFLKNPLSQAETSARNSINKAQETLDKLPKEDRYNNLRNQLQTLINKSNDTLNKITKK